MGSSSCQYVFVLIRDPANTCEYDCAWPWNVSLLFIHIYIFASEVGLITMFHAYKHELTFLFIV